MRKRIECIKGLNKAPSGAPKLALSERTCAGGNRLEIADEAHAIHHKVEVEGYKLITLSADTRALVGVQYHA